MVSKIGWFTTGRDVDAVNLLKTIYQGTRDGRIEGEISYIFINRNRGEGVFSDNIMEISRDWNIPLICFSSAQFEPGLRQKGRKYRDSIVQWRDKYHREVLQRLEGLPTDFSVLAGYMLIVSPAMCHELNMINLHPAPPDGPAGTWQEVIWQLIEKKACESGVMIHMVTPELDKGPPITYCLYKIMGAHFSVQWKIMDEELKNKSLNEIKAQEGEGNTLFRMIRKEGIKRELPLLFETICWLSSGRIKIKNKKVYLDDNAYKQGVCLSEHIERAINQQRDNPYNSFIP